MPKWTVLPRDHSLFIESDSISENNDEFNTELVEMTRASEQLNSSCIWLKLSIKHISRIDLLVKQHGFSIHHATKQYIMLIKHSSQNTTTTSNLSGQNYMSFPSHCAAAAGIVVND